jgi:hypothetical protein
MITAKENTHEMNLRVQKYEIIDYLNNLTNKILTSMPHDSEDRIQILMDLKRAKDLVNNL